MRKYNDGMGLAWFAVAIWLAVMLGAVAGDAYGEELQVVGTTAMLTFKAGEPVEVVVYATADQVRAEHVAAFDDCRRTAEAIRGIIRATPAYTSFEVQCVLHADIGREWMTGEVMWLWRENPND